MALITADGSSSPFLNQTSVGVLQYVPVSERASVRAPVRYSLYMYGVCACVRSMRGWAGCVIYDQVSIFCAVMSTVLELFGESVLQGEREGPLP